MERGLLHGLFAIINLIAICFLLADVFGSYNGYEFTSVKGYVITEFCFFMVVFLIETIVFLFKCFGADYEE